MPLIYRPAIRIYKPTFRTNNKLIPLTPESIRANPKKINEYLSPIITPHYGIISRLHRNSYFKDYGAKTYQYLSFIKATVSLQTVYVEKENSARIYTDNTGVIIGSDNMEAKGIVSSPYILTANHCIAEFMDADWCPCNKNSAKYFRHSLQIYQFNGELLEMSTNPNILWNNITDDVSLLKLENAELPYMKLKKDNINTDFNKYDTIVQLSVNPRVYITNDERKEKAGLTTRDSWTGMGPAFSNKDYKTLYGKRNDAVLMCVNRNYIGEYATYVDWRNNVSGIPLPFGPQYPLLFNTTSNNKIYYSLLPGIGGHSGSGVSIEPDYIIGVYIHDTVGTTEMNTGYIVKAGGVSVVDYADIGEYLQ